MKKAKKIMALMLCAVLLVGATVAGTLAYLTQKTQTVTNTFTVGKVSLGEDKDGDGTIDDNSGLDEAKVNEYGEKLNEAGNVAGAGDTLAKRVTENTYKLIPGRTYVKDPTIHVAAGSEECWLFVEVINGISTIEAEDEDGKNPTSIEGQITKNGWTHIENSNIYYKKAPAVATTATTADPYVVFDSFTLDDNADVSTYGNAKIEVTAFAVQADGFATALEAWNATATGFGKQPISTNP